MPSSVRKFRNQLKKNPSVKTILTEGDSWFHLPIGTNIIDHIERLSDYNVLRIEDSGDEIMQIMSGSQKIKLRKLFKQYKFDALLFSAGGNDIIGSDMDELLRESTGREWQDFFINERFENKLTLIKSIYKELIAIRDDYSPNTTIIVDCYDYIIPSNLPTKLFRYITIAGPWVKPMLEAHGCIYLDTQRDIVRHMIDGLARILQELSEEHERFVFLNTRGIVLDNEWQDEIHPNQIANKRIANKFIDEIKKL